MLLALRPNPTYWLGCYSAPIVNGAIKLLKSHYPEKNENETEKKCHVSKLWQRCEKGFDQLAHAWNGVYAFERPDHSENSEGFYRSLRDNEKLNYPGHGDYEVD